MLNDVSPRLSWLIIVIVSLSGLSLPIETANSFENNTNYLEITPVDTELKSAFEAWWTASKTQNTTQVAQKEKTFQDSPLYPMGRYLYLLEHLTPENNQIINAFIHRYSELGLSSRLQQRYLVALNKQQAWSKMLNSPLRPQNQHQQCLVKRALIQSQPKQLPLNEWQNFWLSHLQLHHTCRDMERHLHQEGLLDSSALLTRIELLFAQQRHDQIPSIIHLLPPSKRDWVTTWLTLVNEPKKALSFDFLSLPENYRDQVAYTSLLALTRTDPELVLEKIRLESFSALLSKDQYLTLQREAGLRLTYRYDEQGWQTLKQLNQIAAQQATLIWQARFAIRHSDWQDLASVIQLMPPELANQAQWRYWLARAFEQLEIPGYQDVFMQLATERSYYGFLAADRVEMTYAINLVAIPSFEITKARVEALKEKYPSLKLIAALVAIDWRINAHREWHHLLNLADEADFYDLATIAHTWELHHLAISTLGQIKSWDALIQRFPLAFDEIVFKNAAKFKLEPSLILSIIRRESAFHPQARSPSGAQGLMQLMPNTARQTARQQRLRHFKPSDTFNPDINIQLGSAYLAKLMNKYQHPALSIAAYNAGPARIDQWLKSIEQTPALAADQWIDSLPFFETRRYVKQVLEHKVVYDYLLNQPKSQLSALLTPIK